MLDTRGRKFLQPLIEKTARALDKKGIHANQVTVFAFDTWDHI